jgi:flagellar hook protein FlgE
MGLASSLTTALTGMQAAETQVDVVGNNLANSQTVGFKASDAVFATQFLQTQSLGSAPTANDGGTNPRQTGLGTRVAAISPNFSQGTIQISSNTSDLAIQGDGFFMVQNSDGESLYTRDGEFKTNANNELVNLTGERVLGYGVDSNYQIQRTTLVPLTVPLGTAATAQQTRNVYLQGTLTPSGDVATQAQVLQSAVLGDASVPRPDSSASTITVAPTADSSGVTTAQSDTGGSLAEGATYRYRLTYVDANGNETLPSNEVAVTTPAGNATNDNTITLNNLPAAPAGYTGINVYRTAADGTSFFKLASATPGGSFTDDGSTPLSSTPLDATALNGNYSYVVTYYKAGQPESRPSVLLGPQNVVNGRIELSNLPTPPAPGPGDTFPAYDSIRIYRNLANDSSSFYLVGEVSPGGSFTDSHPDASISDLTNPGNQALGLDGPTINSNTLLVNVVKRDGLNYETLFGTGTLEFTPGKGGRTLGTKDFTITSTSTVQDLMDFMQQAMGIQTAIDDPQNPIPGSADVIPGESGTIAPGLSINNGQIRVVSNNGTDSAVSVDLSAFKLRTDDGNLLTPNLSFGKIQDAKGQSAVADFIAYDSLGVPLNVRITAVLQSVTDSSTTYRWFADSSDNSPASGADISVGTGLVTFDGQGNLIGTTNSTVTVERRNVPSSDPLSFDINFGQVSGLATASSTLSAARQDGSPAGTLSSFIIGEDGTIRGVFTSGVSRDLGQIRLAKFANPGGLVQRGQNLFAQGVNSGLPIEGDPGTQGIGSVVAGAVELSNTDIGKSLIELVLATTQYRGNARVITAAQQMLDELMNLRR